MRKEGAVIVIKTLFFYVCRYVRHPFGGTQRHAPIPHLSAESGCADSTAVQKKFIKKKVDIAVSIC